MTLGEMIAESRQIFGQPDAADSNFTDAQLTAWANECYRYIVGKLECLPIKERTYTMAETITLNSGTINVNIAKAYIRPKGEWVELSIIDINDLLRMNVDWENVDTGEPTHLVRMGTFSALLYPSPNAANDAQADSVKTYGLEIPTALSGDSSLPDIPANLHDVFPHWMAYRSFSRLGNTDRSTGELILVNQLLKQQQNIAQRFSKNSGWTWTEGDE